MADEPTKQGRVSAVRVAADPDGRWRLGVIGKRTWIVSRGRCGLADLQVPLVEEPIADAEQAVLIHDTDVVLNREKTDVVVEGHAYPHEGRTSFDAEVRVGELARQVRVFGRRRVERDTYGRLLFTPAQEISRVPLTWQSAYGGVDEAARRAIGDPFEEMNQQLGLPVDPRFGLFAYPRNPAGRGYLLEPTAEAIAACELPLLEDSSCLLGPENLVRADFVRWPEGPPVAALGWLPHCYFPRSVLFGLTPTVYDTEGLRPSSFFEVRLGEVRESAVVPETPMKDRMDLRAVQSAAIGMRLSQVLPNQRVELRGLHRQSARWSFSLPAEVPRMVARFAGEAPIELIPRIRTVLLEPDEDRMCLVWVGEIRLDHPPGPKRLASLDHAVRWS